LSLVVSQVLQLLPQVIILAEPTGTSVIVADFPYGSTQVGGSTKPSAHSRQ